MRRHLIAWRNRLLSDQRFHRWAADFPLTRPIARRRAQGLFDLVAGFVYAQTLAACVRLGLLQRLDRGPDTTAGLAADLALSQDAAERLLKAAEALGLAERVDGDRYALGRHGAALLGNAGLLEMIDHHQHLYADLDDSAALLQSGGGRGALAAYWPYATSPAPRDAGQDSVASYSTLMAATVPTVAADILHAYPIKRHRRLLDVGGGEGAFLAYAGARAPQLDLMLFDLPAVAERAGARLRQAGLLCRSRIVAGDFLADQVPSGADLITLVRILHDQDDAGAAILLSAVRAALPPGGVLLIAEPMSGGSRPERVADVYFAFYFLAMGRGRIRSPAEIFDLLHTAGFSRMRVRKTRTPFLLGMIEARP
ncbi:MAG: methyltransferase [Caulobacteraceae bacterium]